MIFDSGLKGDDYVSFVATDNIEGGQLGGERLVESMRRERQGRAAALRRRPRQHRQARGRLPRRDEGPSDRPGRQLESIRRGGRGGRLQADRVDPEQLQEAGRQPEHRRDLLRQRVVLFRRHARPPGQRLGREGALRRFRRLAEPGEGSAETATSTASSSRIRCRWAISPSRPWSRTSRASRSRSGSTPASTSRRKENMEQPGMKELVYPELAK